MIVALDGPAGSGKSSVAKALAARLGFVHLNSGSFYRAVTFALLDAGCNTEDEKTACALAKRQHLSYENGRVLLNGKEEELYTDEINAAVSRVSSYADIREFVNRHLLEVAKKNDIVCEGRDMCTVVFPNATYKFYLDAPLSERAKRRYAEGKSSLSIEEFTEEMRRRDEADRKKKNGALKMAKGAYYIDTYGLTIQDVCNTIAAHIKV